MGLQRSISHSGRFLYFDFQFQCLHRIIRFQRAVDLFKRLRILFYMEIITGTCQVVNRLHIITTIFNKIIGSFIQCFAGTLHVVSCDIQVQVICVQHTVFTFKRIIHPTERVLLFHILQQAYCIIERFIQLF